MPSNTDKGAKYLPTPEEIAEGTRRIREGLTEKQLESRWTGPTTVPVELMEVDINMNIVGGYRRSKGTRSDYQQ